jgi:hypothetical protein
MQTWEQILLGIAAVVIALLFFPGIRHTLKHSRKGTSEDWQAALVPLGLVVLFVLFLIWIA